MSATAEAVSDTAQAPRGYRRRRAWILGLLGAGLVVVLGAGWAFWPGGEEHRLLYTKSLGDGRVFKCYTDGSVLGTEGTEATVEDTPPAPKGSEGGPAIVVRPPDLNEEEAKRAAEAYRAAGRSLEQDQADFDRLSEECRRRR